MLSATSKIGTYDTKTTTQVTLSTGTAGVPIPQPGATVYITEIFSPYSLITPLKAFLKNTTPSTIYDVAYF
jgi:hypothetical protein